MTLENPGLDSSVGARAPVDRQGGSEPDDISNLSVEELTQLVHKLRAGQDEFRAAQTSLAKSLEQYQSLYHELPVAYFVLDDEDVVKQVNRAGADLLGETHQSLVNRRLSAYVDPDDRHDFSAFLTDLRGSTSGQTVALTLRRTEDTPVYVRLQGVGVAEQRQFQIAALDIREVQNARMARTQSEERLQFALRGAPIILFNQDTELRYTWLHNPLEEFPPEDTLGKRDSELMDNQQDAQIVEAFKRSVLESGVPDRRVVRITYRDMPRYYDLTVEPLFDEYGTPLGITCAALDITEQQITQARQQSLAELMTAQAQLTTIEGVAEIFAEVKISLGAHFVVVALFSEDAKRLEVLNSSSIPQDVAHIFNEIALDASLPIADAFRTRSPLWLESLAELLEAYPHMVSQVTMQAVAALPVGIEGENIGAIAIQYEAPRRFDQAYRDFLLALTAQCAIAIDRVSKRELAREAVVLEERHRLARELHDAISQSLYTAQLLSGGLIEKGDFSPQRIRSIIQQLNKVLTVAQAEMRVLIYELRPDQLQQGQLSDHIRYLMEREVSETHIKLHSDVPDDFLLPADVRFALYRITQEALNNARKYAHSQQVDIDLWTDAEEFVLEIVDNGQGFDVEEQATGFGLTSMRERAEKIGARISVDSKVGVGTRVRVRWRAETA